VLAAVALSALAGPLAWNAVLHSAGNSDFFHDAPVAVFPVSWQDTGSGVWTLAVAAIAQGATKVVLRNVCGHRYIGTGLRNSVAIEIEGTPGNDLAMFMDGPSITVRGNGQDGVGNTMTSGQIVIHGSAGDLLAHSLRGGRIFVEGAIGYVAFGLLVGAVIAAALTPALGGLVATSGESDAWLYIAIIGGLAVVDLLAAVIPASRAARADAVIALRRD
jgi:hypothetical protein